MTVGVPVPQDAQQDHGAQPVHGAQQVRGTAPAPAPLAEPSRAPLGGAPRQDPAPVFSTTPAPTARPSAPQAAPGTPAPQAAGDHLAAAVTALVLTAFGVLIVSGRVVTEGPVVLVLSRTHGVHLGDLLALGAWAAGVTVPLRRDLRTAGRRALRSRRPATSGGARRRRG